MIVTMTNTSEVNGNMFEMRSDGIDGIHMDSSPIYGHFSQSQDRVMMTLAEYGWMKYLLVTFRSILRTHVQFLLNIAMEAMAH